MTAALDVEAITDDDPTATDDDGDDDAGAVEDSAPADEDAGAAMEEGEEAADEALPLPVGVSPDRMHPVLSVNTLGQVTCL